MASITQSDAAMSSKQGPYIVQTPLVVDDFANALRRVQQRMDNGKDLQGYENFFPAKDNEQNRDILHVTSAVLADHGTPATSSHLWEQMWTSESNKKMQSNRNESILDRFYADLFPHDTCKCLVPLCGKSYDMVKLAATGVKVVGVEIVEDAIEQFALENDIMLERETLADGNFVLHSNPSSGISIVQGDFLNLHQGPALERFSAVLDVRSLTATPPDKQQAYATALEKAVAEGGRVLMQTVEFNQQEMHAPYSISTKRVSQLFSRFFHIKLLQSTLREPFTEHTFLLTRKPLILHSAPVPQDIQADVRFIFKTLQAVARKSLKSIGYEIKSNLPMLSKSGDLDVLRFLSYQGEGTVLKRHADPALLTVHIALDEDVCVHDVEVESKLEDEQLIATVFSGQQMSTVTRGQIEPSMHKADASRKRFAVTFNLYVDSNTSVSPMDIGSYKMKQQVETGLDYVERIFGTITPSTETIENSNKLSSFLNIEVNDVRDHWKLMESLFSSSTAQEVDPQVYACFLTCVAREAASKGAICAPPNPPREIRECWLAHMLQPGVYRDDCSELMGAVLPHRNNVQLSETASDAFLQWWKVYSGHNYPNYPSEGVVSLRMDWKHLHSARKLYGRLVKFGTSFVYNDSKALTMVEDYHRYVLATEQRKGVPLAPGPLIDVVWHAHQTTPAVYNSDMNSRNFYLDHHPSEEHQDTKPWLRNTVQVWQELFPECSPPLTTDVQAGCGCCYEPTPEELEAQRKEEERRRKLEEERQARMIRINKQNILFKRACEEDEGGAWRHSKIILLSTKSEGTNHLLQQVLGTDAEDITQQKIFNMHVENDVTWKYIQEEHCLERIKMRYLEGKSIKTVPEEEAKKVNCIACTVENSPFATVCSLCNTRLPNLNEQTEQFPEGHNKATYTIYDYRSEENSSVSLENGLYTDCAVYIVFCNLKALSQSFTSKDSNQPNFELEKVMRIINGIVSCASEAPILLVGYQQGALEANSLLTTQKKLKELSTRYPALRDTLHGDYILTVTQNNTTHWNTFRKTVNDIVVKQSVYHKRIPARWLACLEKLKELKTINDGVEEIAKIREIGNSFGVVKTRDLIDMLHCFHLFGFVHYFRRNGEYVFTKPDQLLKYLNKIICDPMKVYSKQRVEIRRVALEADYKNYVSKSRITQDLLEYIWGKERWHFLLDFMESNYLLAPFGATDPEYYIPSIMKNPALTSYNSSKDATLQILKIPRPIFNRLCCLAITFSGQYPSAKPPSMNKNICSVSWPFRVKLAANDTSDEMSVSVNEQDASKSLPILIALLKKLDVVEFDIRFPKAGVLMYKQAKEQKLVPWFH